MQVNGNIQRQGWSVAINESISTVDSNVCNASLTTSAFSLSGLEMVETDVGSAMRAPT
jgi:hypothetical protein